MYYIEDKYDVMHWTKRDEIKCLSVAESSLYRYHNRHDHYLK